MTTDHIIGEEKSLKEIIKDIDIVPLFQDAVSAGVSGVILKDSSGEVLFQHGNSPEGTDHSADIPVKFEGEVAGNLVITGDRSSKYLVDSIGTIIHDALKLILKSRFKSLLASDTHETVIQQSYDELLETNNKLKLSEMKYRDLAGSLEKKVQERTDELKKAHAKLLQQEKIASVGQLAAGVAHEINNPLGFIASNINSLKQYVSKIKDMLLFYRSAFEEQGLTAGDRELSQEKWKKNNLDFILSDVDELVRESLTGADRVRKIVSDLKGFSHIDDVAGADIHVNDEIDRTLNILTHETPEDAEIIKEYNELPVIEGNAAQICQVFFNIILNAFQAKQLNLKLRIRTRHSGDHIRIDFSDNGPGIPDNITNRIFEPFFTTKEVGEGTGMGLNVAYDTVVSYGGTIDVYSVQGNGTTFSLVLPVKAGMNS